MPGWAFSLACKFPKIFKKLKFYIIIHCINRIKEKKNHEKHYCRKECLIGVSYYLISKANFRAYFHLSAHLRIKVVTSEMYFNSSKYF